MAQSTAVVFPPGEELKVFGKEDGVVAWRGEVGPHVHSVIHKKTNPNL
jgi:hypothetical protein